MVLAGSQGPDLDGGGGWGWDGGVWGWSVGGVGCGGVGDSILTPIDLGTREKIIELVLP